MHHPRASVISPEPERNIVAGASDADNVTANGVGVVVGAAACTPDDIERVLDKALEGPENRGSEYSHRVNGMDGEGPLVRGS